MENYKADVHIHSSYSFDSDLPIKTIIEREKELGNDVIAILIMLNSLKKIFCKLSIA